MKHQSSTPSLDAIHEKRAVITDCNAAFRLVHDFAEHLRSSTAEAPAALDPTLANEIAVVHSRLSSSWVRLRAMGLADERRAAIAGGRRGMANGTRAAIPLTSALCLGTCAAAYGMVLVTAIHALQKDAATAVGGRNVLKKADYIVDVDLCGLSRERLRTTGLVSLAPTTAAPAIATGSGGGDELPQYQQQQPNLRTCDGIKSAINHARSMWRSLHPVDAPLDEFLFVVQAAIGRAAVFPTPDVLATGVSGEVSGYREEFVRTGKVRVSVGFFSDMWLHLSSMLSRRWSVLSELAPAFSPEPPAAAAAAAAADGPGTHPDDWRAEEEEKAHYLANGASTILWEALQRAAQPQPAAAAAAAAETGDGSIYIPEKQVLVEWAAMAGQIAAADDLLRQVIQVSDRAQLWPGDRELHAAYAAGDDDRPAAILAWKTAGGGSDEQTASVTDPIVILRTQDIDKSVMAAACLLRIMTQEYQNVGVTELALDALCVHWDDQLEAATDAGGSATLFTVPSLVQIHSLWVVTFEGVSSEPLSFSAALRGWMFVCVRMEELQRLPFSISMLLQRMLVMRR